MLASVSVLKIDDLYKYVVVQMDAWNIGLGGVLMWEGYAINYISQKLKYHENYYATHDLELVAIVIALRMWRKYFLGRRFQLRTYHLSLKHLREQPTLNARQSRWMEILSEFIFKVKHVKGKENKVEDASSRKMHLLAMSLYNPNKKEIFSNMLTQDELYL